MTLVCLEKTIRKWSISPTAALNSWFHKVNDWNQALITALNFLAGNYQGMNAIQHMNKFEKQSMYSVIFNAPP